MLKVLKDCLVSQGRAPAGPPGRLPGENVPGRTRTGNIGRPQEPIWFYYNKANQSILGFQLPADVGKVFPRFGLLRFLSPPSPVVVAQDPPLLVRGPHLLGGCEAGPGGHEEVEVLFGGVGEDHRGSLALSH